MKHSDLDILIKYMYVQKYTVVGMLSISDTGLQEIALFSHFSLPFRTNLTQVTNCWYCIP